MVASPKLTAYTTPAPMPAATATNPAANSTAIVERKLGLRRPTAKMRIGAGANSIAKPPIIGIAATARNSAPESAAALISPIIALRDTLPSPHPSHAQGREWEQRDDARAFDCDRQLPLMPRAVARGSRRNDLAALGNKALQRAYVLEIHFQRFIRAEAAYFTTAAGTASTHSTAATSLATASFAAIVTTTAATSTARTSITAAAMLTMAAAVFASFFVCHFYS